MALVKKFGLHLALMLVLVLLAAGNANAQDSPELRITAIDLDAFPTVGVRLLTRDAGSAPITDLSALVLRENRVPIPEFELARVTTGVDLVFVIDANDTLLLVDDNDTLTRRDKVASAVEQFARQHMNPTGLDRVTVIVPDESGAGAVILAEDVTTPQELAEVMAAYQPVAPPRITPLNDMMAAAIDHLAATRDDGRFQSVLLFTDGGRLDQQLAYQDLVSTAQAGGLGLFGAILGATADPNEVESLERLAGPTRGQVIHLPDAAAAEPLFRLFQSQGQQTQARYRSLVRRAGDVDISAALGNTRTATTFALDLAQPLLTLDLTDTTIRRAGTAIDTPLPLLQPAVYPLQATITWPDGIPRNLTEFAFLVNGRRQPLPADVEPDADGRIPLAWDLSNTDVGAYELQVLARDVLGYDLSSAPQTVTIAVDRPQPHTPTPPPTVVPVPSLSLPDNIDLNDSLIWLLPVLFALGVLGAGGAVWAARRKARRQADEARAAEVAAHSAPPEITPADRDALVPTLERLAADGTARSRTTLSQRDTLIGRDRDYVTLVLDDPTVAPLHARLRQTGPNEFWLYDEGSTSGTYLNHVRLGLAPQPVQHGDHLQFGRVALRFTLQRLPAAEEPGQTAVAPNDDTVVEPPIRSDHTPAGLTADANEDSADNQSDMAEKGPAAIDAQAASAEDTTPIIEEDNKGEDPQ